MLVKLRPRPTYENRNTDNTDENAKNKLENNYQVFCVKVLDHSWRVENEMMLHRLAAYKSAFNYVDIPYEELRRR